MSNQRAINRLRFEPSHALVEAREKPPARQLFQLINNVPQFADPAQRAIQTRNPASTPIAIAGIVMGRIGGCQ
ncbi:hypothetical protein [Prosthecochloris aestuarii]|uniref:hypothetical protein n=1 Tax=Prosthecochloris aestuarii TaxID=1102 RepID=UPI0005A17590|nr:hypothetical protein [Prosthecochloris aestuarii]